MTATDETVPPPPEEERPEPQVETVEERAKKLAASYGLSDTEYVVLQRTTCKDAPREIAAWFMLFCMHRKLDPISKQVYLFNDKRDNSGQWHVVTGIDGLRVIASRSPYYRGQSKPVWAYVGDADQQDGIARFTADESQYGNIKGKRVPETCEVIVRRAIPQAPTDASLYLEFFGIVRFEEFCKYNRDGKIFGNWEVQPEHQVRIRAEAMGLRMGFPEEVGGIYLEDEIRDLRDRLEAATAAPAATSTEGTRTDQLREKLAVKVLAAGATVPEGVTIPGVTITAPPPEPVPVAAVPETEPQGERVNIDDFTCPIHDRPVRECNDVACADNAMAYLQKGGTAK